MKLFLTLYRQLLIKAKYGLCMTVGLSLSPMLKPASAWAISGQDMEHRQLTCIALVYPQSTVSVNPEPVEDSDTIPTVAVDIHQRVHLLIISPIDYLYRPDSLTLFGANMDADSLAVAALSHIQVASVIRF